MDIDETIDAFRRGVLDFDCEKIVLRQQKDNGERLQGPGYIRQDLDGGLIFRLYVTESENAEPLGQLDARLRTIPGTLPADDLFYDLEAVGHDGTSWAATRVLPAMAWDFSDGSARVASGPIQSLTARMDMRQQNSHLRLHFFEEYDVPLRLMSNAERLGSEYRVLDRAEFEASGYKFEVRKREGSGDTIVELNSSAPFPRSFHLRVQEALQYITGKTAMWRARLEGEQDKLILELASPWRKSPHTRFNPPLSPVSTDYDQAWKLFSCYLAYVVAKTESTYWNPVAYHLYNACEATANSLDARAVAVSVAVEAIAGLIDIGDDTESNKRLALFQTRMRECLAIQSDFADLTPRMEGLINTMGKKRPQDTLRGLAETGHVEEAYIKAWSYLRNRHVHPTLKDLKKPDLADYQELLDHIRQAEVLLRQLTFCLIGYRGYFTDYGAKNFPTKQYPLL